MTVLQLEKFKRDNSSASELPILEATKQFLLCGEKTINETVEGLTIDFVISTEIVDRDQDTISAEGWETENYKKNPVILWAHDRSRPPVARSLNVWVEDGKLKSTAQFMPKEVSGFGYSIGQMYAKGFLNAVSVGFRGIEARRSPDAETRPWGVDFIKQELFEYSCVPLPSNPEALIDAKTAGIDTGAILDWAVECLETKPDEIPIGVAEKIYNILKNKSTFVISKENMKAPVSGLLLYKNKINESRGKLL